MIVTTHSLLQSNVARDLFLPMRTEKMAHSLLVALTALATMAEATAVAATATGSTAMAKMNDSTKRMLGVDKKGGQRALFLYDGG